MDTQVSEELVETIARAIFESFAGPAVTWERNATNTTRERYRNAAQAAIAAMPRTTSGDGELVETLKGARLFVELVRVHWHNLGDEEQVTEAADCLSRIDAALSRVKP